MKRQYVYFVCRQNLNNCVIINTLFIGEGMKVKMDDKIRGRLQARIDELTRRMRVDSNDLDYESHLRQKRELQSILDHMNGNDAGE